MRANNRELTMWRIGVDWIWREQVRPNSQNRNDEIDVFAALFQAFIFSIHGTRIYNRPRWSSQSDHA